MASVLLIAPGVDCTDVGEAWVGYQWAAGLQRNHSVTLLTYRKRGRPSAVGQLPGVRVIEWDELPLVGRAERFNSLLKPWYPHYYYLCRQWLRTAVANGARFDIAHQPVPVAMRYPSPLSGFRIPYVVGPVGGGMASPAAFADVERAPWYMDMRRYDAFRIRRDPMLRRSFAGAAVVLGIAPYVADLLSGVPIHRLQFMSETAVAAVPAPIDRRGRCGALRLLFVGRLIRTKGARDIIAAMAAIRDLDVRLDIVGDGFDRAACEELSRRLQLTDRIHFHGHINRSDVDGFYRQGDVFVFPSYREPGGNVAFEAMSYGLPMIVSDRGGPGYVVTSECGVRVRPGDPQQFASEIAMAIRAMAMNPERRLEMGDRARRRVGDIGTWEQKVAQIERLYTAVLDGSIADWSETS